MKEDIVSQLEKAIRTKIIADLASPAGSAELGSKGLGELLTIYGNWRSRLVAPRPREVHRSSELIASPKSVQYAVPLDAIDADTRSGSELTRYLSRGILHAFVPATGAPVMHKRRDRDLLIADWGIHHLHLSTHIEPDGFVARSSDLLFAAFSEDDAYFIDIYPHSGSWVLEDIVRTVVGNWPQAGLFNELQGAVGLAQIVTDDERLRLRQVGVTSLVDIDGHVYAPRGQTTAGTPIAVTQVAHIVQARLREMRTALRDNPELLNETVSQAGYTLNPSSHWNPLINAQGEFGLVSDGLFLPIGRLP